MLKRIYSNYNELHNGPNKTNNKGPPEFPHKQVNKYQQFLAYWIGLQVMSNLLLNRTFKICGTAAKAKMSSCVCARVHAALCFNRD